MQSLLNLVQQDTTLTKVTTAGTEYSGPCPFCGGADRFNVWPEEGDMGRWWCRRCNKSGDRIAYLLETNRITKTEAYALRHNTDPNPRQKMPSPAQAAPPSPTRLRIIGSIPLAPLPPRSPAPCSYPLTFIIPPDCAAQPGLALPHRQWQRLPDGSIRVIFPTAQHLRDALDATHAIRNSQLLTRNS